MDFLHVQGGGHLIECNYCMETVRATRRCRGLQMLAMLEFSYSFFVKKNLVQIRPFSMKFPN